MPTTFRNDLSALCHALFFPIKSAEQAQNILRMLSGFVFLIAFIDLVEYRHSSTAISPFGGDFIFYAAFAYAIRRYHSIIASALFLIALAIDAFMNQIFLAFDWQSFIYLIALIVGIRCIQASLYMHGSR